MVDESDQTKELVADMLVDPVALAPVVGVTPTVGDRDARTEELGVWVSVPRTVAVRVVRTVSENDIVFVSAVSLIAKVGNESDTVLSERVKVTLPESLTIIVSVPTVNVLVASVASGEKEFVWVNEFADAVTVSTLDVVTVVEALTLIDTVIVVLPP